MVRKSFFTYEFCDASQPPLSAHQNVFLPPSAQEKDEDEEAENLFGERVMLDFHIVFPSHMK